MTCQKKLWNNRSLHNLENSSRHSVLGILQHEVREGVDAIKDSECHQGLHRVQIELREANVQIQQCLPKERVKGQSEPLEEVVLVYGHTT